MQLDLACQHTTLTPAMRHAVEEKFQRLSGHIDKPLRAHVVLTVEDKGHTAEATLHADGKQVHAQAKDQDMYAAIDRLVNLLDRRWRKIKTSRLRNSRGRVPGIGKEKPSMA